MRAICAIAILLLQVGAQLLLAEDKPTSLSDARSAVEANLRTPEGKAFDEKLGTEFVATHLGPAEGRPQRLRKCHGVALF